MRDQRRRRGRHGLSLTATCKTFAALVLWAGAATLCAAQPPARTPEQRQSLLTLAEQIGRVHSVRTLCRGPDDQTWRNRMSRLLEVEGADSTVGDRLTERFNAGYAAFRRSHPECGVTARQAGLEAARTAAALAAALATEPATPPVQQNSRAGA